MDVSLTIGAALLMGISATVSWFVKTKYEELRAAEERLSEERRRIYTKIIDPLLDVIAELEGKGSTNASETVNSYEYRKATFDLILIGDDNVIWAFNRILDYEYSTNTKNFNRDKMISSVAELYLEIRKSITRNKTKINTEDMRILLTKDILGKKS